MVARTISETDLIGMRRKMKKGLWEKSRKYRKSKIDDV
jgi:hypothetical protein